MGFSEASILLQGALMFARDPAAVHVAVMPGTLPVVVPSDLSMASEGRNDAEQESDDHRTTRTPNGNPYFQPPGPLISGARCA